MSVPTSTKAWSVKTKGTNHFDGLTLNESVDIPSLGDKEVLVKRLSFPLCLFFLRSL